MQKDPFIPFNRPYMTGKELACISEAHENNMLAGDGQFTASCHEWMEKNTGCKKALLTHSCTGALEMSALLADLKPGDEVIMPSYTFVSTANAFVLMGAVPVFVDIRPDTLNLDEAKIEAAITSRTRAIVVVHYAGVACDMDEVLAIARLHELMVIEDAAQGFMSCYKGRPLGAIGEIGTISFHETKNIISGEGGALLVNDSDHIERAEIIRDKGTNRRQFFNGLVDKYTWVDMGSSYLPGEIIAAFLWAQLEEAGEITRRRLRIWETYNQFFIANSERTSIQLPHVPDYCEHNGHMYFLLLKSKSDRDRFIEGMAQQNIGCVFHYVPLHLSPAGKRYGKVSGDLVNTELCADRLVRMPLWIGVEEFQERICDSAAAVLQKL